MKDRSAFLKESHRLLPTLAVVLAFCSSFSRAQIVPECQLSIVDFPGAYETGLNDVNNKGQAVGLWSDKATLRGGFLWMNGKFLPISFPHSEVTWPTGINNHGDIVGDFIITSPGRRHSGFVLSQGEYRALKVGPQTQYSYTADINDVGDILGVARFPYVLHQGKVSYFWVPNTSVPTTLTYPAAINNLGWIVGSYVVVSLRGDEWHGFLIKNGEYTTIDYPAATVTQVTAVNDAGFLLGIWANDTEQSGGTFVWRNGVFESFPVTFDPTGISDNGWIAGSFDRGGPASQGVVAKCH